MVHLRDKCLKSQMQMCLFIEYNIPIFFIHLFIHLFFPFTSESVKSKIDKFSQITYWSKLKNNQHHRKVPLNNFSMKGHRVKSLKAAYQPKFKCEIEKVIFFGQPQSWEKRKLESLMLLTKSDV